MPGTKGQSGRPPKVVARKDDTEDERIRKFQDFVYVEAMGGRNVAYARLFADMKGLIKQRKEETDEKKLSGDDIARAVAENERTELADSGVGEMPTGPELLRDEVREDTGCGEGVDSVQSIPAPDKPVQGFETTQPGSDSQS